MTTIKQIEANQKNAQKSTGPVSIQGRAVVAQNAVKHGILSSQVLINQEEREVYEDFRESILQNLFPRGNLESFLADRVISTAWRLRRIVHVETLIFEKEKSDYFNDYSYREVFSGSLSASMVVLSRYERSLENSLYRALKELRTLQEQSGDEILAVIS
jgi:hypothetical protein